MRRSEEEAQAQETEVVQRVEDESLADKALEAIVRSQQLRARSRTLRKKIASDNDAEKSSS